MLEQPELEPPQLGDQHALQRTLRLREKWHLQVKAPAKPEHAVHAFDRAEAMPARPVELVALAAGPDAVDLVELVAVTTAAGAEEHQAAAHWMRSEPDRLAVELEISDRASRPRGPISS